MRTAFRKYLNSIVRARRKFEEFNFVRVVVRFRARFDCAINSSLVRSDRGTLLLLLSCV